MTIIPRGSWCTVPRRALPARIADRQPRLWLHHGASGSSTVATANAYARWHIHNNGWVDVGYSWLIAAGEVLEGRGPGRQGAHTQGDNASSYGICMVGDYSSRLPSARDLDALRWLLDHGHAQGWFPAPALTGGHRDAPGASTSCPGTTLHRHIPAINARPVQTAGQEVDDLTPEQAKKLDEIHTALGLDSGKPRRFDDDARRTRLGLRALGRKLGLKVDPNGDPDRDIVA